jgi:hypothetical protein
LRTELLLSKNNKIEQKRIEQLEAKLQSEHEVLPELLE